MDIAATSKAAAIATIVETKPAAIATTVETKAVAIATTANTEAAFKAARPNNRNGTTATAEAAFTDTVGTTVKPPMSYPRDRLDVHVEKAIAAFKVSTFWASFVTSVRGREDLHHGVKKLPHPAAHLLSRFQKSGTSVMMKTTPWSAERIDHALRRGPHQSYHRGIEFLREEYADMMDKEQWTV